VHRDSLTETVIKELTIDRSTSQILDSPDVQVETLIDPLDDLLSGYKVGFVHETDHCGIVVHEIDGFSG
jgi:hypothetical protein